MLHISVTTENQKQRDGARPLSFLLKFERSPAAGALVVVGLSAFGALLGVYGVLLEAGAAYDIVYVQGAVVTKGGCCHFYSSGFRIAEHT